MMTDATCYESYLRYPTSVKLLWESVAWLQSRLSAFSKDLGQRCPRNKFKDVSKRYLCYSKKRKRKQSRTRMMKRGLLRLLEKQVGQVDELLARAGERLSLPASFRKRFPIIRRVLEQEKALFAGQKVSDRIVSVDKPHLRPIVRARKPKRSSSARRSTTSRLTGSRSSSTSPLTLLTRVPGYKRVSPCKSDC